MGRPRRNQALNFDQGADEGLDRNGKPKKDKRKVVEPCPCGTKLPKEKCAPKHVRESGTFRAKTTGTPLAHKFIGFDLETKRRDREEESGFDDPFKVGVDDGVKPGRVFDNSKLRNVAADPSRQAYLRGGCVREFL
jgi:hypothetical protein